MARYLKLAASALLLLALPALQGCLATKLVTVPVKVAYGTGKLAVKVINDYGDEVVKIFPV